MALNLNQDDANKLKELIDHGVQVKQEIKDLQDSLKERIDQSSRSLDIDKKKINSAIRAALKASEKGSSETVIEEEQESLDDVSYLLKQAGY